jgi:hypothetical protein
MNAFRTLMQHIKDKDEKNQNVIIVQVENKIGMLPNARDYHPDATKIFNQEVPARLIQHLQKNKNNLSPSVLKAWEESGFKTKGTWEQVFGKSLATDEIFIAWHFADFTNKIAGEGKKIYALPMFVNAALTDLM